MKVIIKGNKGGVFAISGRWIGLVGFLGICSIVSSFSNMRNDIDEINEKLDEIAKKGEH